MSNEILSFFIYNFVVTGDRLLADRLAHLLVDDVESRDGANDPRPAGEPCRTEHPGPTPYKNTTFLYITFVQEIVKHPGVAFNQEAFCAICMNAPWFVVLAGLIDRPLPKNNLVKTFFLYRVLVPSLAFYLL